MAVPAHPFVPAQWKPVAEPPAGTGGTAPVGGRDPFPGSRAALGTPDPYASLGTGL